MRRLSVLLSLIAAPWLVSAWPAPAAGSVIDPTFQFTNTTGGPISRADFTIDPPGKVVAPIVGTDPATGQPKTVSPVTIDPTRSSGFDPNNFSNALGTGPNIQGLRLLFGERQVIKDGKIAFEPVSGPNGEPPKFLENGGTVTFQLHVDPAYEGLLTLHSQTVGLIPQTLVPLPTSTTPEPEPGGTTTPPTANTPEPVSLLLWSSMAGLGLIGARRRAARTAVA